MYLDEFGRYTSVLLPKEDVTSGASEIFVPVSASEFLNRARITIRNKPPHWATRYKFFVKTNKEVYYNVFGTLFYIIASLYLHPLLHKLPHLQELLDRM